MVALERVNEVGEVELNADLTGLWRQEYGEVRAAFLGLYEASAREAEAFLVAHLDMDGGCSCSR